MLVDDEYMIKLSLAKLIGDQGDKFQVVGEAEDGDEALDLIGRLQPNLVITDIRMPGLNGLELVELAKPKYPETEFVILSGYEEFEYARQALRLGVSEYLLKPLKPEQVNQVLETVYDKFENRRRTKLARQSWINACRMEAKSLAEQIELLNQERVESCLAFIRESWLRLEGDLGADTLYSEFIAVLLKELSSTIETSDTWRLNMPATVEQAIVQLKKLAEDCMERLREQRNWGVRQQVAKAEQYIRNYYSDEALSLQQVAEHVGMSPAYFSKVFKDNTGTSFIQFVTRLRMEQACRLLSDPMAKTYEAAFAAGYSDYPYFNKAFKKIYGVSPSEYRKNMGFV